MSRTQNKLLSRSFFFLLFSRKYERVSRGRLKDVWFQFGQPEQVHLLRGILLWNISPHQMLKNLLFRKTHTSTSFLVCFYRTNTLTVIARIGWDFWQRANNEKHFQTSGASDGLSSPDVNLASQKKRKLNWTAFSEVVEFKSETLMNAFFVFLFFFK